MIHIFSLYSFLVFGQSAAGLFILNNSLIPIHELLQFIDPTNNLRPNTGFVSVKNGVLFAAFRVFDQYFKINAFEVDPIPVQVYGDVDFSFNSTHYLGSLYDDKSSIVRGYLINEIFSCTISTAEDIFHIEPITDFNSSFAIVYKQSAVVLDTKWYDQTIDNFEELPLKASRAQRSPLQLDSRNKMCEIELISDHTYARYHRFNNYAISGELTLLLQKANEIFSSTDWNFDGIPDNVGLKLANIIIYQKPNAKDYYVGDESLYGKALLEAFSYHVNTRCAVLMVIHREPSEHAIGMMYRGFPSGITGGICSKPVVFSPHGHLKSKNIGFVTTLLHKKPMARGLKIVTFTHEIGHAFGADHDTIDPSCVPNPKNGFYLMYPSATQQNTPNTFKFSPCSRKLINAVLKTKSFCFKPRGLSKCGNGIKEGSEECDCGSVRTCNMIDPCCEPPGSLRQCKYKFGHQCTPDEGPCCSTFCKFITLVKKKSCSVTCYYSSFCNGKSSQCPPGTPIPAGHKVSNTCTCDGRGNCILTFPLAQKIKQPIFISFGIVIFIIIFVIIICYFKSKSKSKNSNASYQKNHATFKTYQRLK